MGGGRPRAAAEAMAGGDARRVPASSASQVNLPSVSSAYPMRRAASLSSLERNGAERAWEVTLRDRVGSPGPPPGRDVLPSLYDRGSQVGANYACSGVSRSAPPSTVGPSASIVAWYAQFQCEGCGKIPLSLDARYCSACGETLNLPMIPGMGGGNGSQCEANEPRADARGKREDGSRRRGNSGGDGTPSRRGATAARSALTPARPDKSKRPPLPPGEHRPMGFAARESQCAVWLGNIKPRIP